MEGKGEEGPVRDEPGQGASGRVGKQQAGPTGVRFGAGASRCGGIPVDLSPSSPYSPLPPIAPGTVSYTHLRAHETGAYR
eukprot:4242174-Pyramimonas_sp.AAC.1